MFPAKHGLIFDYKKIWKIGAMSAEVEGLTSAKNKVTAKLNHLHEVIGYNVSANQPATVIGNNVLMHNTPYSSAFTHLYLLQRYLIQAGENPEYVKAFKVKHCRFDKITLTFCIQCVSAKAAKELVKKLKPYAGIILKSPRNKSDRMSKKVGFSGSGDSQSLYLNKLDDRSVLMYVKDRKQRGKFSEFENSAVEKEIYALGESVLRIEITLGQKYLTANVLDAPQAWRGSKGRVIFDQQLEWLRSVLKADFEYRVKKPQPTHMEGLQEKDKSLLNWYFLGKPVTNHPQIKSGEWKKSPIKCRILDKLRIDIDIPWKNHCRMAIPGLGELLSQANVVKPPQELLVASRTIIWPLEKQIRALVVPLFHGLHRRLAAQR